ncbi:MAG: transcription elongation factor GreA [Candidatus Nealsonbacteria bacterium]|nr:transcription elongation factor GreA [Candidatus Nealsonbacteria bacterium]
MTKYLTKEGLEKLKKELEYLKTEKRKEIAERIRHAASFGDISENAAYDEAKESQAFVEGRIQELRKIISQAQVIKEGKGGEVKIGSTVLLELDGEKEKFRIVGPEEVDITEGRISYQSPLGSEILGKREGEKVVVDTPNKKKEYRVVKIE